ncbi:helix-turn-helix domain-containing protein, partial [Planctomycetota bacterium]
LFALVEEDRRRVLEHSGTTVPAVRLFELLPRHPIVSIGFAVKQLGTSKPTAGRAVDALANAGVLVEMTGRKRDRSWAYQSYLHRLREGTEIEGNQGR